MRRREVITLFGAAAAWPLAARAQQPGRVYSVGILVSGGALLTSDERRTSLVNGLAARGFIEGRNLAIESRYGIGQTERLAGLVKELDDWKADAIVTLGYPASRRSGAARSGRGRLQGESQRLRTGEARRA
jgi:putative tryptophan/tyrosine transport system substrate-binding protein